MSGAPLSRLLNFGPVRGGFVLLGGWLADGLLKQG